MSCKQYNFTFCMNELAPHVY